MRAPALRIAAEITRSCGNDRMGCAWLMAGPPIRRGCYLPCSHSLGLVLFIQQTCIRLLPCTCWTPAHVRGGPGLSVSSLSELGLTLWDPRTMTDCLGGSRCCKSEPLAQACHRRCPTNHGLLGGESSGPSGGAAGQADAPLYHSWPSIAQDPLERWLHLSVAGAVSPHPPTQRQDSGTWVSGSATTQTQVG